MSADLNSVALGLLPTAASARGYVAFGAGVYRIQQCADASLVVSFRRPGEEHYAVGDRAAEFDPTPIPADEIIAHLRFLSAAALDGLEQQLRELRASHFPGTEAHPPKLDPAHVAIWAEYVAGIVVAHLGGEVDDERIKPIAGIISRRLWALSRSLAPDGSMLTAASRDVLDERERQINVEGWTPAHDDAYAPGVLTTAGCCYAMFGERKEPPSSWPWPANWWKPKDGRNNLVRAGALILAEIERLDRQSAHPNENTPPTSASPASSPIRATTTPQEQP